MKPKFKLKSNLINTFGNKLNDKLYVPIYDNGPIAYNGKNIICKLDGIKSSNYLISSRYMHIDGNSRIFGKNG